MEARLALNGWYFETESVICMAFKSKDDVGE